MRIVLATSFFGLCSSAVGAEIPSPIDTMRTTFPREVEIELALSGAPPHLRSGAAVYVYGSTGFEKARVSTNGFTCLLNRDAFIYGARQFKPTCWDAVGGVSYVPVMLKVGELLAKGQSPDVIRAAIDAGFKAGMFHAPTTSGVAYMLAGDIELEPKTGHVVRQTFPGHYMFYAIGATTAQLGVTRAAMSENRTLPSVFAGGAGGNHGLSYIIVAPSAGKGATHEHSVK
jgi:hypothetical protein